jgi:predicted TIM-barrel fold metal-dependent hydrolase
MKVDCHCHIFSLDCVPMEFRKRFCLNLKNPVHKFILWLVRRLLPKEAKLGEWLDLAELSIAEMAQKLVQEMDEAGIDMCIPLMMDMKYCSGFGGEVKRFEDQITETAAAVTAINNEYGRTRMLPFVAADPRRENFLELVTNAIESGNFKGIKIYPVMGYTPTDSRLYPLYEYCQEKNIPITTHCENGGIPGLDDYYALADPKYWKIVLEAFPSLTLNLAHNDRTGKDWQPKIAALIKDYPNVYTDISYDTEMWYMPRKYFKSIKHMLETPKIQDRVLYGSDWYMGRYLWTVKSYLNWYLEYSRKIFWCRVKFTEREIQMMTEDNPKRFLGM